MRGRVVSASIFPAKRPVLRRSLARQDICPECGGQLDTGWECNDCGYDAMVEATTVPPRPRAQRSPHPPQA